MGLESGFRVSAIDGDYGLTVLEAVPPSRVPSAGRNSWHSALAAVPGSADHVGTVNGIRSSRGPWRAHVAWAMLAAVLVSCSPTSSTTPQASESPAPSASTVPTASPTESPAPETGLTVRLTQLIPNPPTLTLSVEIMSDGQVVLGGDPWTTRSLTAAGLDQVAQEVLAAPLLQASADYPSEPIQPSGPVQGFPIGLIHPVWAFTVGEGADAVVVTSAAWLGDEVEAQYFAPSPERKELDRLANLLVNIPDWVTSDGWTTATWDAIRGSELPAVGDGVAGRRPPRVCRQPSASHGHSTGRSKRSGRRSPRTMSARDDAGTSSPRRPPTWQQALSGIGVRPQRDGSTWRTDGGWVGLYLSPRTVDGFPTCADVAPYLPPYGG